MLNFKKTKPAAALLTVLVISGCAVTDDAGIDTSQTNPPNFVQDFTIMIDDCINWTASNGAVSLSPLWVKQPAKPHVTKPNGKYWDNYEWVWSRFSVAMSADEYGNRNKPKEKNRECALHSLSNFGLRTALENGVSYSDKQLSDDLVQKKRAYKSVARDLQARGWKRFNEMEKESLSGSTTEYFLVGCVNKRQVRVELISKPKPVKSGWPWFVSVQRRDFKEINC